MPDPAARHGPGGSGPGAEQGPPVAPTGADHRQVPYEPGSGALLPTFVARLREAGLDPDVERICDALWLARWTGQGQPPLRDGAPAGPGTPRDTSRHTATEAAGTGESAPVREPPPPGDPAAEDPRIALYPVPPGGGPGRAQGSSAGATALTVGVPAAPALPAPLELQRALRPLQRYRPAAPPVRRVLDEAATAELSARAGGMIIPVFRGVLRADALLQLVMDASSSMRVWDRLFTEMQLIFGQLGAFWDVQTRYLHQGPDGSPTVSRSPDPAAAPMSSADRLSDPTGRRVTLVISDCAGPLWYSGRAQRLLYRLGRQAPTAVLQPLPQRMWNRTRLPVSYGVLSRGGGLSGAAVLNVTETGPGRPVRPGSLAIPVLQPAPGALGAWAALLSGTGSGRISGAVGWVCSDHAAAPAPVSATRPSSLQLVSRFRSAASPVAGRLAVYLAAAPLYLPVMQLVQRTMLPDSGPSELAEVLLSGLLTRTKADGAEDGAWYEFAPGVQDALLAPLGRDEALLVLKHCSEYIEQRFGRSGPNFPALAFAQLGDATRGPLHPGGDDDAYTGENGEGGAAGPRVPHPFAEVAARVLERFMPLPEQFAPYGDRGRQAEDRTTNAAVESARGLLLRFDSDSMVQYLIDAVQLLRGATDREQATGSDPELWAEFARCLLRLWEVQGGIGLLRDAERAAERAAAHPHAVRERAVLARVLHVSADDRRQRGDNRGALELLRRADREYTFACAAPGLDPGEAFRLTLERVRALEAQWRLGGDSALLQGAVGMLEAFADVWPDQENRPAALPLAHGRTLLRLAGATSDAQQAQVYAGQAARSLRGALTTGAQHTVGGRSRILLDLVDALLLSGDSLDEAATLVGQALETVPEERQASSLRTRAGRIGVARYEESGDPAELQQAAEWFAKAAPGIPRDSPAHAGLLDEWGRTLLRRAELPGGSGWIGQAVRVLRDCRTETEAGAPRQAARLLMLGQALMLRHRGNDDRVDLREAEHLFGLAARQSHEPLTTARCWLELGLSHLDASRSLHRPARLDEAAEAFRAAADAARTAEADEDRPGDRTAAVRLRAEANHWRGSTYEAAGRPRAARDAYRAALAEWRKLPDGGGDAARLSGDRLAELERGEFNGRTGRQPG